MRIVVYLSNNGDYRLVAVVQYQWGGPHGAGGKISTRSFYGGTAIGANESDAWT
jgi:hypothetical protein